MTNNVIATPITNESVVHQLLVPHKNGLQVHLEPGKSRTGTVTSVFHKGLTAAWRVKTNEGEPQPHIQIAVGDKAIVLDDHTYAGFSDAVRALFNALQPALVSDEERAQAAFASVPTELQNLMTILAQPNGADQAWTFDIDTSGDANVVLGKVTFLRGKPEPLTLSCRFELQHREVKGKVRSRIMMTVGEHDPVRVRNADDAIEGAYDEFDCHCPGQQRHMMTWDDTGDGIHYFAFHTGTRISRLAQAAHGQYVNQSLDDDADADAVAANQALEAFVEVFLDPTTAMPRYKGTPAKMPAIVQRIEMVTTSGFLA